MAIHFILIVGRADATENYKNAVCSAGFIPVITDSTEYLEDCRRCHDSLSKCLLSRIDLLLLPGGGDISPDLLRVPNQGSRNIDRMLDHVQFAYFHYFLMKKKPILGICKGMQLINAGLGGTLIQDMDKQKQNIHAYLGYKDNLHSCTYVSPEKTDAFPMRPVLKQLYDTALLPVQINSAHHQSVDKLPKELFPFQYAPDRVVEGFIHRCLPIMGLQWHPERLFYTDGSYLKLFLNILLEKPRFPLDSEHVFL